MSFQACGTLYESKITPLNNKDFLIDYFKDKNGIFTCMRTKLHLGSKEILQQDFHIDRLINGYRYIYNKLDMKMKLKNDILFCIKLVLQLIEKYPGTFLITIGISEDIMRWHVMNIYENSYTIDSVILTKLENVSRKRPLCKEISWLKARKTLETLKTCKSQEVIMIDKGGNRLLEGLTTNVFVLVERSKDMHVIETAPTQILPGSIRELILSISEKLGYQIDLSFPLLSDAYHGKWLDMFIVNVSKPVTRVKQVILPNNHVIVFDENEHPFISHIRQSVQQFL